MAENTDNQNKHNTCLIQAVDKHLEQIKCHLLRLEPTDQLQIEWKNFTLHDIKEFQNGQLVGLRRVFQ